MGRGVGLPRTRACSCGCGRSLPPSRTRRRAGRGCRPSRPPTCPGVFRFGRFVVIFSRGDRGGGWFNFISAYKTNHSVPKVQGFPPSDAFGWSGVTGCKAQQKKPMTFCVAGEKKKKTKGPTSIQPSRTDVCIYTCSAKNERRNEPSEKRNAVQILYTHNANYQLVWGLICELRVRWLTYE